MSKHAFLVITVMVTAMFWLACRQAYVPPETSVNQNYVVIEGFIKGGTDSTLIRISRTVKIRENVNSKIETNATVTVEDDQNNIYNLKETATRGTYGIAALGLFDLRKYRLRVKTGDNQVYISDYVAVKNSPPIDSVGYKALDDALYLYVNTHDAAGKTIYYRWDYEETWHFHVAFQSLYLNTGANRPASQTIYTCFNSAASNNIVLATTKQLTKDLVFQVPITQISPYAEKLQMRYSIVVRQYALTAEAYDYWALLKTNTEKLGSIFDAQPSALIGNIKCMSNPALPVIGYISAGFVASKRIYIDKLDLPSNYIYHDPFGCHIDTVSGQIVIFPLKEWTSPPCGDCTTRGRTTIPPFWKER